jgi:nitrite reductase/ring-hydroxylating ferredoxin subunit
VTETLVDRIIRRQTWLEPVADAIQGAVGRAFGALGRPGAEARSVLYGTRVFGHPLHPALTDLPVGAWIGGVVADYASHFTQRIPTEAGDLALAVGLVGALGSAVTGYNDFSNTVGHERRVAVAHGLSMTLAVALDAASMGLRWWAGSGLHPLAVGLSTGGLAVLLGGAYLGGHVVFGMGTMVNHLAFTEGPEEPVTVGPPADFPEGEMRRVRAGGMDVLLVRRDGVLFGIADVCSHAGGPLHEGSLDGCVVTCPWHGSRFWVDSGQPLRGPATFPQPTFTVEERDGVVSVKLGPPAELAHEIVGRAGKAAYTVPPSPGTTERR